MEYCKDDYDKGIRYVRITSITCWMKYIECPIKKYKAILGHYSIQLRPAIPEVKGPTNFICYWRIFVIANIEH